MDLTGLTKPQQGLNLVQSPKSRQTCCSSIKKTCTQALEYGGGSRLSPSHPEYSYVDDSKPTARMNHAQRSPVCHKQSLQVHVPASRNTSPWKAGVFVSGSPAIHAPAPCEFVSKSMFVANNEEKTLGYRVVTHTHTCTVLQTSR